MAGGPALLTEVLLLGNTAMLFFPELLLLAELLLPAAGRTAMQTELLLLSPYPQVAAGEAVLTEHICLPHPEAATGEAAFMEFESSGIADSRRDTLGVPGKVLATILNVF